MEAKNQKVYQICIFIWEGELNGGRDGLNNVSESLLFTAGKAYPTVKNLYNANGISLIIMLCFENTWKSGSKTVHYPMSACWPTQLQ